MLKPVSALAVASLLLVQGAAAAMPQRPAPPPSSGPPARQARVDPVKLRDCEDAWSRQRIKKGSHKAFVRACVRHG